MNKRIKKITILSITVAILAIIAPISINVSLIPFNLSLFIIFIISSIFSLKDSLIIILLYIILGLIGLPVFAGYVNAYEALSSISGGFILGFIPCIISINLIQKINKNSYIITFASMFVGLVLCYLLGIIHFMLLTSSSIIYAFSVAILPFIFIDLLKIIIACIITFTLNNKTKIMDSIK